MIGPTGSRWWAGWSHTITVNQGVPKLRELKLHMPNSKDPDARDIVINFDMTRPVGKLIDIATGALQELDKPQNESQHPVLHRISYRRSWWRIWEPKRLDIVVAQIGPNRTLVRYDPKDPAHELIGKAGFTSLYHKGKPITSKEPHDDLSKL